MIVLIKYDRGKREKEKSSQTHFPRASDALPGFPEGLKETPDKRKMESSYGMTWDGSREARRHRERRGDATNRPPGHLHLQPAAPPWNDTEM